MPSKKKKYNARFPPVSLNFAEPVRRPTTLTYVASLNGIRPAVSPMKLTHIHTSLFYHQAIKYTRVFSDGYLPESNDLKSFINYPAYFAHQCLLS